MYFHCLELVTPQLQPLQLRSYFCSKPPCGGVTSANSPGERTTHQHRLKLLVHKATEPTAKAQILPQDDDRGKSRRAAEFHVVEGRDS